MSGLTVPIANVDPGRAARPQFEASGIGQAVSDFGRQIFGLGSEMETARLDREFGRLQIDMTRDLGDLRTRYESMGDPDMIAREFPAAVEALKKSYVDGTREDGRPRVDPKLRDRWSLGFDDLATRHGLAIGARTTALQISQRAADYVEYRQVAGGQAAATDPGARDAIYTQHDEFVDRQVASGVMTPEEGAKSKIDFRSQTEGAAAIGMIASDPQGYLEADDAGEFSSLSPEARAQYRVRAEAAIAAAAEGQARAAKAADAEADAKTKADLGELLGIVTKGRTSSLEALLDDPIVQEKFPEQVAQLNGARFLRDNKKFIELMSPTELGALRDELASQDVTREWQTDALALVDARIAAMETGWGRDGVAFAKQSGHAVPELPVFDPRAPEAFASGLASRAAWASVMEEQGFAPGGAIPLVDEAERAALSKAIGTDQSSSDRLAAIDALSSAGERGLGLARAAGASDVFLAGMEMVADGAAPETVAAMLRGEQAIKLKTAAVPAEKDRKAIFDEITGGAFANDPASAAQIMAASLALYADGSTGLDPEDVAAGLLEDGAARRLYAASIQRVLGGSPDANGDWSVGGIQNIGQDMIVLPSGVGRRDVERAIDVVGRQLQGVPDAFSQGDAYPLDLFAEPPFELPGVTRQDVAPAETDQAPDIYRALTKASLTGSAPPDLGADPAKRWANIHIEAVDGKGDVYVLWYEHRGQKVYVEDASGQTFGLSLKKLVREAR